MTTERQKQLELFFAKAAADMLDESWNIKTALNELDWPDLIVSTDSREFGLEVREIYLDESKKGSQKRATENLNQNVLNAIIETYYQVNKSSIKASFLGDISKKDKIVKTLIQEESKLSEFEQSRIVPYTGCTVFLTKLPAKIGKYTRWQYISDQVGWVAKISKDSIQKFVSDKALNLPKYSKNCSDVRLLLVSNRTRNSGKARLESSLKIDPCGFEEVYYFSYPVEIWKISS